MASVVEPATAVKFNATMAGKRQIIRFMLFRNLS
jgi:hypothetical protein